MATINGKRVCDGCRSLAIGPQYLATWIDSWPDTGDIRTARMDLCRQCLEDADYVAPRTATL